MSTAIVAMMCAGLEAEIARRAQLAGNAQRMRAHAGWAVITAAVGAWCALTHWIFG